LPISRAAAQPAPPAAQFGGDTAAKFLFDLAKDPLKNFVMDQIGLTTTSSQLKRIEAKIDALSQQLNEAEKRLSRQTAELAFQVRYDNLRVYTNSVKSLVGDKFVPVAATVTKVKEISEHKPIDYIALASAVADYNTHRLDFLQAVNTSTVLTKTNDIHDLLQPDLGDGFLFQYGQLIMAAHRELTTADSQRVIDFYEFAEEYQAFATWMAVEGFLALGGTSLPRIQPTLDHFFEISRRQRDGGVKNGLHAPIPTGVVIDRGPDPVDIKAYTTANKTMFAYAGTGYTWIPVSPFFQIDTRINVPNIAWRAQTDKLRGFGEWTVPSGGQVDGLFAGLTAGSRSAALTYLQGLFGDQKLDPGSFVWSSDLSPRASAWGEVHEAVSLESLAHSPQPQSLPPMDDPRDPPVAREIFNTTKGGLFVSRPTGQAQYLP
jgi:hypothetical protein